VVINLPQKVSFAGNLGPAVTQHGQEIVLTLGRLEVGQERQVQIPAKLGASVPPGVEFSAGAIVRSSTVLPLETNTVKTKVVGRSS